MGRDRTDCHGNPVPGASLACHPWPSLCLVTPGPASPGPAPHILQEWCGAGQGRAVTAGEWLSNAP